MPKQTSPRTSKKPAAARRNPSSTKPRQLKPRSYRSFRVSRRIKHQGSQLSGAFRLFRESLLLIRTHWKVLGGIMIVYALLNIVLVRGFGATSNLGELKDTLQDVFTGSWGQLTSGVALFAVLLSSTGSTSSESASVYQTLLVLMISLAVIWALRQLQAGIKITAREAFYKGMYPMIPFVLVLLVVGLQLVPLLIGSTLYSTVISNGLAATAAERGIWALAFFFLALLSLYMVTSSLFALYIVTLPDMTPMRALRSARQLVLHRRWTVMRKVVFLPIALGALAGIIIIPFIIFITPLAEYVFFCVTIAGLVIIHSYMYRLYRELL